MVNHYKRDDNAFISARKWLEEYNYEIILYLESPVQAIGFMTAGLDKIIEKNIFRILFFLKNFSQFDWSCTFQISCEST